MIIHNSKAFMRGSLLMISFLVIFTLFFMDIFPGSEDGKKTNGLVFADHLFNTLSKGSSNFFDPTAADKESVEFRIKAIENKEIEVTVPMADARQRVIAEKLVSQSGIEVNEHNAQLVIKGNLYALLSAATSDSEIIFHNDAAAIAQKYEEQDGHYVLRVWWQLLTNMIKPMQRKELFDEANIVSMVIFKAIEPSYNFYGITAMKVNDNIPLVAGFLIFYVIYTMWYGFAIFELFEGIGLTMKKSVKQEV